MLVAHGNGLCATHASEASQAAEALRLAESQLGARSLSEINAVLAELFSAVSNKQIDVRRGALLAYVAQLMIQTTKAPAPAVAPR
jgi:hypothetical protein